MAQHWEYKLLVGHGLSNTLRDQDDVDHGPLTAALLNKLGRDGWEVCSHTLLPATLILKRQSAAA
jgi:hypothetical protein